MNDVPEEYCYLTMTTGPRTGTSFMLYPEHSNRIGRGTDCEIVVVDPNCSRVHARIQREEDGWWLEDESSRNGSFVNDERVVRHALQDRDGLRFGETQFIFYRTDEPPTLTAARSNLQAPTVIREAQVDPQDSSQMLLAALENAEFAHDLLVIYQLSVKLLEFNDPDPVIHTSLDLLHDRTKASVVGFLWATEDGKLRPRLVVPNEGEDISLNETLSNVVYEQGRAVWISSHADASSSSSLRRYSDAICVPLVRKGVTVGVVHLYLKQGRFRRADFDFAISVANLMAVSLVRTRRDMALKVDHQRLANEVADFNDLIGESEVMRELKSKIAKIGRARGGVLIRGESGSGKELVARACMPPVFAAIVPCCR